MEIRNKLKISDLSYRQKLWVGLIILILFSVILGYILPIYMTIIVGDSMEPKIEHHDIVILSEVGDTEKGDIVDVSNPNDSYNYDVLHQVKKVNETHVQTQGVNNNYLDPPSRIKHVDGEVIWTVSPPDYIKNIYADHIPNTYGELAEEYN